MLAVGSLLLPPAGTLVVVGPTGLVDGVGAVDTVVGGALETVAGAEVDDGDGASVEDVVVLVEGAALGAG